MRNMRLIMFEYSGVQNRYGRDNVVIAPDASWIKIARYPLLKDRYNLPYCTLLIMIPTHYPDEKYEELYLDKDLIWREPSGRLVRLPNVHENIPGHDYEIDGYQWLCLHTPTGKNTGLFGFLDVIRSYLTNPFQYRRANGG